MKTVNRDPEQAPINPIGKIKMIRHPQASLEFGRGAWIGFVVAERRRRRRNRFTTGDLTRQRDSKRAKLANR